MVSSFKTAVLWDVTPFPVVQKKEWTFWRYLLPPYVGQKTTKMHGVTSQKTVMLMLSSMNISDLMSSCFFLASCCVCKTCVCNKAVLCCVGCSVGSMGFQAIWTVCNWCHITFMAVGGMMRIGCHRNSLNCDVCLLFAFVPLTLQWSRSFLKAFDFLIYT